MNSLKHWPFFTFFGKASEAKPAMNYGTTNYPTSYPKAETLLLSVRLVKISKIAEN